MLLDFWPLLHRQAPDLTGGYHPPARHQLRVRTVIRYSLHITGNGTIGHHDPAPIAIRTQITSMAGAHHGSRHDHHLERTSNAAITHRCAAAVNLAAKDFRIDDPDEWIVFNDPTLS